MNKPMRNYTQLRTFSMNPTKQEVSHLDSFEPTPVRKELLELAAKHTNTKVKIAEREDGILDIYAWADDDLKSFYEEFGRLENLIAEPLNEPILPDDCPVHQGYLYVVNGNRVVEFIDGINMNVSRWKALRIPNVAPVHEIRRCDIIGRRKRLPLKKERETIFKGGWDSAGRSMKQAKRKPRSSNKIKKVI